MAEATRRSQEKPVREGGTPTKGRGGRRLERCGRFGRERHHDPGVHSVLFLGTEHGCLNAWMLTRTGEASLCIKRGLGFRTWFDQWRHQGCPTCIACRCALSSHLSAAVSQTLLTLAAASFPSPSAPSSDESLLLGALPKGFTERQAERPLLMSALKCH